MKTTSSGKGLGSISSQSRTFTQRTLGSESQKSVYMSFENWNSQSTVPNLTDYLKVTVRQKREAVYHTKTKQDFGHH